MATLIKLADGRPALLFYRPDTHVVVIKGADYEQARAALSGQVDHWDHDSGPCGRTVHRLAGGAEVTLCVAWAGTG